MMGGWYHMGGLGWFFGSAMMLAWIALIGLVVYLAVRLAHDHSPRRDQRI